MHNWRMCIILSTLTPNRNLPADPTPTAGGANDAGMEETRDPP